MTIEMRQPSMKRFGLLAAGLIALLVFAASASGAKSGWSVKPNRLNFGSSPAGVQGAVLSVTVTNTSSVSEQVAGANVLTGDVADFAVQGSSTCLGVIGFMAAGSSRTVNVAFNPQAVGTFKATLQIDLTPGPPAEVTLTGRGA